MKRFGVGGKTFFLTFFGHLPIHAAHEVQLEMLKQYLFTQAVSFCSYFFSFIGFKVCLKVS
jgi:hypothetical protein